MRDRIADRMEERRRRRSYHQARAPLRVSPIPVLNLLATAPAPRLGGLQSQLVSRLDAEAAHRGVALLYPMRGGFRLEVDSGDRRLALTFGGESPPSVPALTDPWFEQAVARAAAEVGARALHVEGLAGIPFGSLLSLARSGLQLILSVHDFSLFCLRPNLLESPQALFCGYSRDPERCVRCLSQDWELPPDFQESRRSLARELLLTASAVLFPSEFLRDRHLELFAGLLAERQRVVPPGSFVSEAPPAKERPVRHIAYIGSVQPHKGALVFEEVVLRMSEPAQSSLRWSVYGGGDPALLLRLRRLPHVKVRGYYRAGSLVHRLLKDRVDLALLLSIVPESFSLALSECFAAGVPVVAFDHGAIAERIRRQGGGLIVEPRAGAVGIADVLEALASGRRHPSPPPQDAPVESEHGTCRCEDIYRELGLL